MAEWMKVFVTQTWSPELDPWKLCKIGRENRVHKGVLCLPLALLDMPRLPPSPLPGRTLMDRHKIIIFQIKKQTVPEEQYLCRQK